MQFNDEVIFFLHVAEVFGFLYLVKNLLGYMITILNQKKFQPRNSNILHQNLLCQVPYQVLWSYLYDAMLVYLEEKELSQEWELFSLNSITENWCHIASLSAFRNGPPKIAGKASEWNWLHYFIKLL